MSEFKESRVATLRRLQSDAKSILTDLMFLEAAQGDESEEKVADIYGHVIKIVEGLNGLPENARRFKVVDAPREQLFRGEESRQAEETSEQG